jgi:hypothetical protein
MRETVHTRVLRRAAEILGGFEALRAFLQVPGHILVEWTQGVARAPNDVFLKVVDLLAEHELPRVLSNAATERAVMRARRTAAALTRSAVAINESVRLRELINSGLTRFWDPDFYARSERRALLQEGLEAAIELTGADMGNVQLLDAAGGELRIEAQRGFQQPFLEFFARVRVDHGSACGAALRQGRRVVVPDVASSALFGVDAQRAMLEAHALAAVCTPLIESGRPFGMLSTHYRRPRAPSVLDQQLLDLVSERTARWLRQRAS